MENKENTRNASGEQTKPAGATKAMPPTAAAAIVVEDLSELARRYTEGNASYAVFIHNVFTPDECREWIRQTEARGYEPALLNVGRGRQILAPEMRNNDRCIVDDPIFAQELFGRTLRALDGHPHLREPLVRWRGRGDKHYDAVGCNERLRILRYDPGTYFAPHFDGSYRRGLEAGADRRGEFSRKTVQLYLNEGFRGGATRLMHSSSWDAAGEGHDVVPRTGSVLVFDHEILHEGSLLKTGRKYAMRTDIMYTDKGPGREYARLGLRASMR